MKGIILAGGSGTRLYPTTVAVNKHFLPIYNKPMIYYPLSVLMLIGLRDILLISNPEDIDCCKKCLSDGSGIGIRISYRVQERPEGLAHGLIVAEDFVGDDSVGLILGDNIFFGHGLFDILVEAKMDIDRSGGAYVFGYYVHDPERYGIIEVDESGRVLSLTEKPSHPNSNWAGVGLYFYDNDCIGIAKNLLPSPRGEIEITSLNQEYLKAGKLKTKLLGRGFAWFDAGTHDSFLEAGEFVAAIEKRTGLMLGCIEEIAYRKGWIGREQLLRLAIPLEKTDYGRYLKALAEE